MKICKNYSTTNPTVCNQTTIPFSTKIDFLVCKKTGGNIDTNTCKHTYSTRFDTATQSIKSNRCLNVLYDQPCRKWSVDNF